MLLAGSTPRIKGLSYGQAKSGTSIKAPDNGMSAMNAEQLRQHIGRSQRSAHQSFHRTSVSRLQVLRMYRILFYLADGKSSFRANLSLRTPWRCGFQRGPLSINQAYRAAA